MNKTISKGGKEEEKRRKREEEKKKRRCKCESEKQHETDYLRLLTLHILKIVRTFITQRNCSAVRDVRQFGQVVRH